MTDVDGTITWPDVGIKPEIRQAVCRLQENDIIVGLVSGRTMPGLMKLADDLSTRGPIIAENGGLARLSPANDLLELGYTRKDALEALNTLKELYPGSVRER